MRQTLLRIRLDEFFTSTPLEGITTVGIGWLLLVLVPAFGWWLYHKRDSIDWTGSESSTTAYLGIGVLAVLATAPLWTERTGYYQQHGFAFLPVYGYGFMLFVGFLLATWWAGRRAKVVGLSLDNVWDGAMILLVGGIAGARVWYLVQYRNEVFRGKTGAAAFRALFELQEGGLVLYGGIVGGSLLFALYAWRKKIDALLLADVLVPSFFVGLGFGRLGCFLNGCCFGDRCTLPWGVEFPRGSVPFEVLLSRGFLSPEAAATMPLHPTQVYSAVNAFLIAGLLHAYFRYRPKPGSVIALAAATYPITRFVIELLRNDEKGQFSTSLTISQLFSILICPLGLVFVGWLAWATWFRSDGSPGRPPTST